MTHNLTQYRKNSVGDSGRKRTRKDTLPDVICLESARNACISPLRAATDQTLHEADETLLVHGVPIDHEADLPLTAQGRDHIDPLPLRLLLTECSLQENPLAIYTISW